MWTISAHDHSPRVASSKWLPGIFMSSMVASCLFIGFGYERTHRLLFDSANRPSMVRFHEDFDPFRGSCHADGPALGVFLVESVRDDEPSAWLRGFEELFVGSLESARPRVEPRLARFTSLDLVHVVNGEHVDDSHVRQGRARDKERRVGEFFLRHREANAWRSTTSSRGLTIRAERVRPWLSRQTPSAHSGSTTLSTCRAATSSNTCVRPLTGQCTSTRATVSCAPSPK